MSRIVIKIEKMEALDYLNDASDTDDCDNSDSDVDVSEPTPKRRKTSNLFNSRKWSGAAIYKTKYQRAWQRQWPFIAPVDRDPHSFHCKVCLKNVSCGHQGERDIIRHTNSHALSVSLMLFLSISRSHALFV